MKIFRPINFEQDAVKLFKEIKLSVSSTIWESMTNTQLLYFLMRCFQNLFKDHIKKPIKVPKVFDKNFTNLKK